MFHLISLFAQSLFFILMKMAFFTTMFFIIGSLLLLLKPPLLSFAAQLTVFMMACTQSYLTSSVVFLALLAMIFLLDATPYKQPKIKLCRLVIENLKIAIKLRENLHMSDFMYFSLRRLKLLILSFMSFFLALMFCSSHQIFMMILIFVCSSTAMLAGMSISFFSNLFSLPFSSSFNISPPNLPPLESTSSSSFANFLKEKMNSHPLEAMVEESFYEDNLQMGDFFIAYPIFFKSSLPPSMTPSINDEILSLWHTIRWESAFSKQTGSAASRWSSVYGLNFSSMPSSAHSVHTPLIPVFNDEIFSAFEKAGLPTFNPFNQPPEWSPYDIVTSFLGWSEEEKKEERLVEMEEED